MLRLIPLAASLALIVGMATAEDIKVGVSPGEHAEIMEEVAKVAAPKGLNIEVIEFSDYVVPNQALNDGDLNANSFQHRPYLENQIKDLADLPEGGKVAIPNDPTNGGRALLVLQDLGVIKLAEGTGLVPSPLDVTENAKNLSFLELDAAQLPRALADADIAIINTNYALASGLNPKEDAIASEKADSPYVNIIVVRKGDEGASWVKPLVEAYHSPEVKKFIDDKYQGSVITSW